jgi:hypothetical protein
MDEMLRLLDDARGEASAASRGRERLLRQAAEEGATLVGTLLDLAEAGAHATVRTTDGRTQQGAIRLVGADFFALDGDVWIALAAVATVRPNPGEHHPPASGDRHPATDLRLLEALAGIAPERPRLAIVTDGGDVVAGELRSVGADVVTLRLDGGPRAGSCYVAGSAVRLVLRSG